MSSIKTIEAGVTVDEAFLSKYENAVRLNHEASHYDEPGHGAEGIMKQVLGGGGGALLGAVGTTAAICFTSIQGTIFNNPVLSATVIAGAVVGAAAGVLFQRKDSELKSEWHQETATHLQAVEQEAAKRPHLSELLKARREAAIATAEASVQSQDASDSSRNRRSFQMGVTFGSK